MGRSNRKRITSLVIASLVAAVLLAIMVRLDRPLRTAEAPRGIVSFELAGSPETARRILTSWGPTGRRHAAASLWVDYAFLVIYAWVLSSLCVGVARRWPEGHPRVRHTGVILAGCQWLAALLDLVENVLLQNILAGAIAPNLPVLARWCALSKFFLIACGWLYIILAGGILRFGFGRSAESRYDR